MINDYSSENKNSITLPIFNAKKTLNKDGELYYDIKTNSLVVRIGGMWKFFPTTTDSQIRESFMDHIDYETNFNNGLGPTVRDGRENISATFTQNPHATYMNPNNPNVENPPPYNSFGYPNLENEFLTNSYANLKSVDPKTIESTKIKHEHVINISSLFSTPPDFRELEEKIVELNHKLSQFPSIQKVKLRNDFSFFSFLKNRFKNVKINSAGDIKFDVTKNKYLV